MQSQGSEPEGASELLAELGHLEHHSRSMLTAVWFPLLVGGIVSLASGPVIVLIDRPAAPAFFWAVGGPVIGLACAAFYATRRIQPPAGMGSLLSSQSASA